MGGTTKASRFSSLVWDERRFFIAVFLSIVGMLAHLL